MPKYRYWAMTTTGEEYTAELSAESVEKAIEAIRANKMFPTKVKEVKASAGPSGIGANSGPAPLRVYSMARVSKGEWIGALLFLLGSLWGMFVARFIF